MSNQPSFSLSVALSCPPLLSWPPACGGSMPPAARGSLPTVQAMCPGGCPCLPSSCTPTSSTTWGGAQPCTQHTLRYPPTWRKILPIPQMVAKCQLPGRLVPTQPAGLSCAFVSPGSLSTLHCQYLVPSSPLRDNQAQIHPRPG